MNDIEMSQIIVNKLQEQIDNSHHDSEAISRALNEISYKLESEEISDIDSIHSEQVQRQ
jgi:hypothetical protein